MADFFKQECTLECRCPILDDIMNASITKKTEDIIMTKPTAAFLNGYCLVPKGLSGHGLSRANGLTRYERPWSSLIEGDEQLDRPNSQTTMDLCYAYVA